MKHGRLYFLGRPSGVISDGCPKLDGFLVAEPLYSVGIKPVSEQGSKHALSRASESPLFGEQRFHELLLNGRGQGIEYDSRKFFIHRSVRTAFCHGMKSDLCQHGGGRVTQLKMPVRILQVQIHHEPAVHQLVAPGVLDREPHLGEQGGRAFLQLVCLGKQLGQAFLEVHVKLTASHGGRLGRHLHETSRGHARAKGRAALDSFGKLSFPERLQRVHKCHARGVPFLRSGDGFKLEDFKLTLGYDYVVFLFITLGHHACLTLDSLDSRFLPKKRLLALDGGVECGFRYPDHHGHGIQCMLFQGLYLIPPHVKRGVRSFPVQLVTGTHGVGSRLLLAARHRNPVRRIHPPSEHVVASRRYHEVSFFIQKTLYIRCGKTPVIGILDLL